MQGDLVVRLDHDGASVACFYNQLEPRWEHDGDDDVEMDANASCRVKVDSQKLFACLQWQQSSTSLVTSSCLLGMIENELLVLHVRLYPEHVGFFTYYIPVHYLPAEGDLR